MRLIDEEEVEKQKIKTQKTKRMIIITIIILVYLMIRYYKLNSLKVLIESIGIIALSQMVLLGIMAITRMPIGEFTIPMVLLVYMISTYICTAKFENK